MSRKALINEISKITKWAIENTDENFTVFFNHTAHCGYIDFNVYEDGWSSHAASDRDFSISTTDKNWPYDQILKDAKESFEDMKHLKKINEEKYSAENIEKVKEEKKNSDIARLKKQLSELED